MSVTSFLVASFACFAAEPSDTIGAAEALLRYAARSYPLANDKSDVCVTVDGEAIPQSLSERLRAAGLHVVPCGGKDIVTRIPIGKPQLGPDGNYQVSYGYFIDCENCEEQGKQMFAFLSHDATGWHVIAVRGGVSL